MVSPSIQKVLHLKVIKFMACHQIGSLRSPDARKLAPLMAALYRRDSVSQASLCRKPPLSAKPKPLHKRQQALLQPVTLAFISYKPYMPAVITHFQSDGRPQFFLAR